MVTYCTGSCYFLYCLTVTYCTAYGYLLYWPFRSTLGSVWLPQSKAGVALLESDTS
jgi:hypothetical protein